MSAGGAGRLLQRRAIQCSFSSVFHVKSLGSTKASLEHGKEFERIFLTFVGAPLVLMTAVGGGKMIMENRKK